MTNALRILIEAIKRVPVVRYALGVAGLAAAVFIVGRLTATPQLAVLGIIGMLLAMVALILLERASKTKGLRLAATVFLWSCLVFIMATVSVLFSAVFFDKPALGLSGTIFKQQVESTLASKAGSESVAMLRQLPPEGITRLLETGHKSMGLVGTGPTPGRYNLPADYDLLKQLGDLGLLRWRMPPQNFEALLERLSLSRGTDEGGGVIPLVAGHSLTAGEETELRTQGYELSSIGRSVFEAIVHVVQEQIR